MHVTISDLEAGLVSVVDLLQGHLLGAHEVREFCEEDAVAQTFLQLGGGRQLLVDARLHPSAEEENIRVESKQPLRHTDTLT